MIVEQRGPEDPEWIRRVGRLLAGGAHRLVVLFLVIADMVLKPGS